MIRGSLDGPLTTCHCGVSFVDVYPHRNDTGRSYRVVTFFGWIVNVVPVCKERRKNRGWEEMVFVMECSLFTHQLLPV